MEQLVKRALLPTRAVVRSVRPVGILRAVAELDSSGLDDRTVYSSIRIVATESPSMPGGKRWSDLTDAELLLLGLVAEMPRHGYQLEQEIERRGMRQWTPIGFSSVYFVLGKLEKSGLVRARKPAAAKARKTVGLTAAGRRALVARTLAALRTYRPTYSSVLLGMMHWSALRREEALDALKARGERVDAELTRLGSIQVDQQPLPDFVEALFDYSIGQLRSEAEWIARTLAYMKTKPWLEERR